MTNWKQITLQLDKATAAGWVEYCYGVHGGTETDEQMIATAKDRLEACRPGAVVTGIEIKRGSA